MSLTIDRGGRPLGVKEAYDALSDYARTYGELPLRLLLHAAVPQSFRVDLLNLLKVNFMPEAGGDLSVDADVLLSPLVEATGGYYFRLDPEVRRQSLDLLDAAYRSEGSRRSVSVARFLIAWLDRIEQPGAAGIDPLLAEYAVVQRWVALALIDPAAVAVALARSLSDALTEEKGVVRARLGGIATALRIPLAGHQPLLSYAQGIDALRTGNSDEARELLEPLGNSEIRVGDVTLRPADALLDEYLPGEFVPRSAAEVTHRTGPVDETSQNGMSVGAPHAFQEEALVSALTILIIRHAEKPGEAWPGPGLTQDGVADKKSLVIRGWQRAGAWSALFGGGLGGDDFPELTAIYAANPSATAGEDPSQRPFETIMPLAARLTLTPIVKYSLGAERDLVAEIVGLTGVVLVSWEHKAIANTILPAIAKGQSLHGMPVKWDGARFDVVLRFDRSAPGAPWSFRQLFPRLLSGDSATPMQ